MRVATLIIIALVIVALFCVFKHHRNQESFGPSEAVSVSWAPSTPNPQNLAYNWGVCISQGATLTAHGQCASQTPPYPPGPPGAGWHYHGQTPRGQNFLILNNLNCANCAYGLVLILMLQAVDVVNTANPASSWATFTIDLSSKSSAVRNVLTDSTIPSQGLYPGSTGFIYTLQLNQPVLVAGNTARVYVRLVRNDVIYDYQNTVPFTTISADNTTGTYTGSFTTASATSPWAGQVPGALQAGDQVTVFSEVFSPGNAQTSGQVFFVGSVQQTATVITPSAPAGVSWTLS